MRELTQQEIDNGPDWATHYFSDKGGVNWHSVGFIGWDSLKIPTIRSIPCSAKPIPRKPFDINECWSSEDSFDCFMRVDADELTIDGKVTKVRAVLFAKHFKVTAEDLK